MLVVLTLLLGSIGLWFASDGFFYISFRFLNRAKVGARKEGAKTSDNTPPKRLPR